MKLLALERSRAGGAGYITGTRSSTRSSGPWSWAAGTGSACFPQSPQKYLEREVKRFPSWLTWQALTTPKLELYRAEATRLGADTWKVRIAVQNTGYLPSYVTKRALERKVTRGVVYEIDLPPGAQLVGGKPRFEGGQLEGRASKPSLQAFLPNPELTGDRGQCEWTVRAAPGAVVTLMARHDRAGRVEATLTLG
jgi:hypothetical protein